jgi:hypothetical protein
MALTESRTIFSYEADKRGGFFLEPFENGGGSTTTTTTTGSKANKTTGHCRLSWCYPAISLVVLDPDRVHD